MRGMAGEPQPRSGFGARLAQYRLAFTNTKQADPRLVPLLVGAVVVGFLVGFGLGLLLGSWITAVILGIPLAILGGLVVFGWRTQRAALLAIEGRPGAAAAVLQSMRGRWRLTPAVAATRKQDFVHRVVGRPGVILVGEGSPARVASLLKQEKRRIGRVVGDTPVHEVSVGDREDQVPLQRLQAHLTRLPRAVKPGEIGDLDRKLNSLRDQDLPMPKGPIGNVRRPKRR